MRGEPFAEPSYSARSSAQGLRSLQVSTIARGGIPIPAVSIPDTTIGDDGHRQSGTVSIAAHAVRSPHAGRYRSTHASAATAAARGSGGCRFDGSRTAGRSHKACPSSNRQRMTMSAMHRFKRPTSPSPAQYRPAPRTAALRRSRSAIALFACLALSGFAQAGWNAGPNMTSARAGAGSVALNDGRVMLIGGNDATRSYNALYSADLYNPTTNTWTQSSYSIAAHYLPGVARLQDGRVLIAGGLSGAGIQTIAETYNPTTNTWAIAASLNQSRYALTLTTLANGDVLAIGGATTSGTPQTTVERYNPATNTWSYAAPLSVARRDHTATLLANGKVLVSAGEGVGWTKITSAELYDPATNTWSPAGNLAAARSYHTATALANGDVLIAGGLGNNGNVAAAERYQAATNTWTSAGALSVARDRHIAVRMPSGKVLIAAGWPATNTSAQLYDPATNSWSAAGNMLQGRYLLGGGLAGNGKAVIAGGNTSTNVRLASSELYTE
jgi:hypothetical protein